jgi:hypothetical protein
MTPVLQLAAQVTPEVVSGGSSSIIPALVVLGVIGFAILLLLIIKKVRKKGRFI